jgi:hypothetical protein
MKSLLVTVVALQLCFSTSAQEVAKKKEVGIVFSNFDNFGATFRVGNDRSLWRFSTVLLSGGNGENTNSGNPNSVNNSSNFGTRISFGKEFRNSISEKFYLRYGADVFTGLQTTKSETKNSVTAERTTVTSKDFNVGFNVVIGGGYAFGEKFLLGVELLPYVQYRESSTKYTSTNAEPSTTDSSGFYYGLSSTSVVLSLVYRW